MLTPSSKGRLYSYLPDLFIDRVENRSAFLGALVFDIFAGSLDRREAVYVENHVTRTFKAVFIDNGHLFGGPHWSFLPGAKSPFCLQRELYSEPFDSAAIDFWISVIEKAVPEVLPNLLRTVPKQWYRGEIGRLQDTLLRRADSLQGLFWEELLLLNRGLGNPFRGFHGSALDTQFLSRGRD
jgi:hypothetical protein